MPRLEQAGGRSAAARTDLESSRLGNCHLGKYPLEVATWEKSCGKVPNIDCKNLFTRQSLECKQLLSSRKLFITTSCLQIQDGSIYHVRIKGFWRGEG